jgi:hypothetical protein
MMAHKPPEARKRQGRMTNRFQRECGPPIPLLQLRETVLSHQDRAMVLYPVHYRTQAATPGGTDILQIG